MNLGNVTGFMIYTKIRQMNGTQDTEFEETFRMCGNWQKEIWEKTKTKVES